MKLVQIITATDPAVRDQSVERVCRAFGPTELVEECAALEAFRHDSENLYEKVRALFFLYAICRFVIPPLLPSGMSGGRIPYDGYEHFLQRRFEEAIESFLTAQNEEGASDALFSALAESYHQLAFQTLANQVRHSVRSVRGNQWMFRVGHSLDHPLRIRREMLNRNSSGEFPVLHEQTPVRMDLTHSAWSDIFFLGMDYPEGARVLNVSVDLAVRGRDPEPRPPVEAFLRVIDEPVLRLTSVDLNETATIRGLEEVFDYARDYLGLLKAAVIAAGIIPPGLEGSGQELSRVLERMVGEGLGLEIVSHVRGIPKGSRLAVSTNLLGCLISACMRATGQAQNLTGTLEENERRVVAARAILGEWLGGSGGGWQDSGGVWPGIKLIEGAAAQPGDPEYGVSRGRLLPQHHVYGLNDISAESRAALQDSLVLVHGGMAQNVGPVLEMVTEKYLLRSGREWIARENALELLDQVADALREGNAKKLGALTTRNFQEPIQTIIPWATNQFTERLIARATEAFGEDFWGFVMLGGMSGGGMGFLFAPNRKSEARRRLLKILEETKNELSSSLPFAMEPVVYDFRVNENGTFATLIGEAAGVFPENYHRLTERRTPTTDRPGAGKASVDRTALDQMLEANGFDRVQHELIRDNLRAGVVGLSQNRLPMSSIIEDVTEGDVVLSEKLRRDDRFLKSGIGLLSAGRVAVVTLAAGAGSRWTQGAGVSKALHPFCKFSGRHRTFIETHIAKSRKRSGEAGGGIPHIFTTSHLTHAGIDSHLRRVNRYDYPLTFLSPGRSIGLRMIPMVEDLRFQWEEMPQQLLDEQQQKVQESLHEALMDWAHSSGEGCDYTDNIASQCLHPVGHWYEVPNLIRNGTLQQLLNASPGLNYLMLHNIDTLGADVDPALLGWFADSDACLAYEMIPRRLEDRGGGLARVDGRPRILEGLAMPREKDEFKLSYYNSMTTWINVDRLLAVFGLDRDTITDEKRVGAAVREFASRMPTYITLKEVKKRWGQGQEDVYPVTQFEKLWGDMSSLPDVDCRFLVVPRMRGQQLKDPAQLDGWLRDGSAAYVDNLCDWG